MPKQQQFSIRINQDLYKSAKDKCKYQFGIGLSPLVKMFLTSFVSQRGVGFYVGDDDLCQLFSRWMSKKQAEMDRKGCAPMQGPRLKDLYDLNAHSNHVQNYKN